jgi:molybdenum cofactor cytidylyltransferase
VTGPALLVLAAGRSTRMRGRDKLMEEVSGRPILVERVTSAQATAAPVFVALPPRREWPQRWAALEGTGATLVEVPDAASGMAASLRAGLASLPADCPGLLVLLADMPEITPADIAALLARFDGTSILRGASAEGTPGHPVLFPARDFAALARLTGDAGGRDLLRRESARVQLVPLPDRHALTDLDTPEDWADWRAGQAPG